MKISVIITTFNREKYLKKALAALSKQTYPIQEMIIVDSGKKTSLEKVVNKFPRTIYLKNKKGYGHTPSSRTIGMKKATGDIIAFIDDDAFPDKTWAAELVVAYKKNRTAAGIGGRAYNNLYTEKITSLKEIGRITSSGQITGNFSIDSHKILPVDHFIGCNMSFRASLLKKLKYFRDIFPGNCLREETDIAIRLKKQGYKLFFTPKAAVLHIGAPHPVGQRFDLRYQYYAYRNSMVLFITNYGLFSPIVLKNILISFSSLLKNNESSLLKKILKTPIVACSLAVGIFWGCLYRILVKLKIMAE